MRRDGKQSCSFVGSESKEKLSSPSCPSRDRTSFILALLVWHSPWACPRFEVALKTRARGKQLGPAECGDSSCTAFAD
jgi:hypothetical protein